MKSSMLETLVTIALVCAGAAPAYAADAPKVDEKSTPAATAADSDDDDGVAKDDDDDDDDGEDEDELEASPDRPTFSAAPVTVLPGHAQLEVGGEFSTADGASELAFPILVRFGVAKSFELRAGLPAIVFPLSSDADSDVGAIQLGAKVADEVSESLSIGALPYFDIAANAGDQSTFSQSTFGFVLLAGFEFSDSFGIGANAGASVGPGSTDEAGPRELFYAASLTATVGFDDLGITAEGFTQLGQYADPNVGGSLSLGYAIADTVVVDIYGGSSAQSGVANVFAGAGVTLAR